MWFKVIMEAEEEDSAIVHLTKDEYKAVGDFLNQVKEQQCEYSWWGGHWRISKPCATKEEAERLRSSDI